MRKLILLLALSAVLAQCAPPAKTDKQQVVVSILPQQFLVEKIAGDMFNVEVLVPPGASMETYSLLPSQLKSLNEASLWLRIGHIGFENAWSENLASGAEGLLVTDTSEGIDLIAGEEVAHGDHIHLHGIDPHYWMAPAEMRILAKNSFDALLRIAPDQEAFFKTNFDQLLSEIDLLEKTITEKIAPLKNRKFLIFHPAMGYFARQFGFAQIALEQDGKEPSPKHLKEMIDVAKEDSIRIVFIQKEFDIENAAQLALEIGGQAIQIDPLSKDWNAQMLEIADKLATHLR